MILFVDLQMLRQVRNTLRQKSDLYLRRTSVGFVQFEPIDQILFIF